MAHHKRHRPKSARAGCLMCKAWKAQGNAYSALPAQTQRRIPKRDRIPSIG